MADELARLLALLEEFLREDRKFEEIQAEFDALWLETPSEALTKYDLQFIDEAHEQLE